MNPVIIGNAELYHGDCREILPMLTGIDAVITDPPYGINFKYYSYVDTRDSLRELISGLFCYREIANRFVILCGITQIHEYPIPDWIGCVTWNTTGSFGMYGYTQWMPILLYGKDLEGFGSINKIMKCDTFKISGGASVGFMRNKDEKQHTCPKPIEIMNWCVNRFSSGTVIDPFMGSGTTGVAAVQMDRRFIGIEIDERYFEISCKRIEDAQRQERLF